MRAFYFFAMAGRANYVKSFSRLRQTSFTFLMLLVIFQCLSFKTKAQLFKQDFSSSAVLADYISSTPNSGQFNSIGTTGTSMVASINNGALQYTRSGSHNGSFSRTSAFSPTPSTLIYKFDINVNGNSAATTNAAVFQLGSGFSTNNSAEALSNLYARLSINLGAQNGEFQLRDVTNLTNSATFSGTQTVTWVLNNSGSGKTYTAPNGIQENIADDKADVWIGTTKVFDDVNVQNPGQEIHNMKFVFNGGAATISLDNFVVSEFCEAPEINNTSFSGKTSGSGTFSASLLHTGGNGASVTKRGFVFSENSNLQNAIDVSENGNFSTGNFNLNVNNLKPNTNYFFSAYAANNCANPLTAFTDTSGFTTVHNAPVANAATTIGSTGFTANWSAPATSGNAAFTYIVEVSENNNFQTIISTQNNISSSQNSAQITGLNPATNYFYRIKIENAGGSSAYSNTIGPVATTNPNPAISINGLLNNFQGNSGNSSATQQYNLSASNLSAAVNISAPSGFEISLNENANFSASLQLNHVNGEIGNTTIYVRLNATAMGIYSGNITHTSTGALTQNVALNGTCNSSNNSDIIANAIFAYTSNINYLLYQSATITNTTNSLGIFGFTLRDGGGSNDADNLPTILSDITFKVEGLANLRTAALFTGNNLISNAPVFDLINNTITFTGLSGTNVTANDNGTRAINLRATFNSTVTDKEQLQISVVSATPAGNNTSSVFNLENASGASSFTTADINKIEVTATEIKWGTEPGNGTVANPLSTFSILATDVNGNIDIDQNNCSVILSTNGNGFSASASYTFTNGIINVTDAVFNLPNIQTQISATAQNCFSNVIITSADISITGINYSLGDKRTTSNGNWNDAIWESCTSVSPLTFSSVGNSGNIPSGNETVHIEHKINVNNQLSCGTVYVKKDGELNIKNEFTVSEKIQVFDGATLVVEAALNIAQNKDFIVEKGGKLILNYSGITSASEIWNGIENFYDGSFITIKNWKYTSALIIGNNTNICTNAAGYLFGNLSLDLTPTQDFVLVPNNSSSIKLCANNFSVNNHSPDHFVILSNGNPALEINGNINVEKGKFAFAALSGTANTNTTINSNFTIQKDGIVNLNTTSSTSANSVVHLKGNLISAAHSNVFSTGNNSKIIFTGNNKTQEISFAGTLGNNIGFECANGSNVKIINTDLSLPNLSNTFVVSTGSTLDFNGFNITGNGNFALASGGIMKITSSAGITANGSSGNVQTSTRTFDGGATYWYSGNSAQTTGTGLPTGSNDKVVIIDNEVSVQASALTRINGNGRLEIRQGTLIETATEYFTDATSTPVAGQLIMTGGTYRIMRTDATVPSLSGSYSISGGTIELAAQGDQRLRGGRTYFSLGFSGNGNKTTSSAISNISGTVSISEDAVLDVENRTFSGTAALEMTGNSRFRMRTLNTTLPQLSGNYTLGAGTIELYGTSATQSHTLRGGVTYHNIELSSAATNVTSGAANIITNASFTINNEMRVKAPVSYLIGATFNINGPGNFILEDGATFKYGSADGIKTSGIGNTDGNIRVSGTRSFSSSANYACIGAAEMQAGDALPSTVNRLMVEKSAAVSAVTLNNDVTVTSGLNATTGLLHTAAYRITLGSNATISETTSSYVTGSVETERILGTNQQENFGGLGLSLTATKAAGITNVRRMTGNAAIQRGQTGYYSIARYFDISPEVNTGLNATMVFSYNDHELNGLPETEMNLYKSKDGGNIWQEQGFTSRDAMANTVTLSGIDGFSRWTLGSTITPLPVELISFTAHLVDNQKKVQLNWITASEINNSHFEVERSFDGVGFSKITEVTGNGTTMQLSKYNYEDALAGINLNENTIYYRLKQVDYNGEFEYSDIKKVLLFTNINNLGSFKSWYNQNADVFNIAVQAKETARMNIKITDIYGRIVLEDSRMFTNGNTNIQLPAQGMKPGIYNIVVTTNEGEQKLNKVMKY